MNFMQILADEMKASRPLDESILPEAAIARLREAAARIAAGNRFKVGDLVTPRRDAPIASAGTPHLVIEIIENASLPDVDDRGNWVSATRHDVVTITLAGGDIVPFRAPHWMLEPYPVA